MTTHANSYLIAMNRKIDAISPNISNTLAQIETIDPARALQVLGELLSHACQGTNEAAIMAGRKAVSGLPVVWLNANLCHVVHVRLNLDDDWEFRRLLELMKEVSPAMMPAIVKAGLSSPNADVREAAQDFAAGRYGQIEGLDNARG